MAVVKFTTNLERFYPALKPTKVCGNTVSDALIEVEQNYKGISDYILDENGGLREHVNIFIGNEMVKDRLKLMDQLKDTDEVYIMQAISGG